MTDTRNHDRQPSFDSTHCQQDADTTEYQSLRGCLMLSALIILCVIIAVACILLFGEPIQ